MIDWQLPNLFPNSFDRQRTLSTPPSITVTSTDRAPNAGGTSLATVTVHVRDEDKWEDIGRVVGFTTAAIIYATTAPVVMTDGPLPFVDAAWLWAGARFAHSGAKVGASAGEFVDDVLIPTLS
jgi:hypothetical protein